MREKIRENASTTSHRIQIIRTNEYYGKFVIGMTNMVNIRETNSQLPWHTDKCDKNKQIINKYITNTHTRVRTAFKDILYSEKIENYE